MKFSSLRLTFLPVLIISLCALSHAQSGSAAGGAQGQQRRQAYLKFIEAQRLKEEAQRLRSTKVLDDAIAAYKETIRLDPASAEPHVDLGELYFFYQTRRDLAEQEAQEAIRIDSNSVGGHLLLARLLVSALKMENNPRSLNLDRTIRQYEKVVELDSRQTEAWALLAELYQLKNDTERRVLALEKWAGSPIPGDAFFYRWMTNNELASEQAWFQLSDIYLGRGKYQQAVDAARRAYEANPESDEYARNLVSTLMSASGAIDELKIYRQLIKSLNSPGLMIGYGSALIRYGRYKEAVEQLRDYVKADPSNPGATGMLAVALRRTGQRQQAIDVLKSGLSRSDLNTRVDLMVALAETYEEMGRDEDAIAQYEQGFENILAKGPLTPVNTPLFNEVVTRLVRVCRRAGNQARLQSILTRTRRVIDEHNSLIDSIAIESLRQEGKRREALDLAQGAIRRNPDDRSLQLTESLILTEMKRYPESIDLLNHLIDGKPETAAEDSAVYLLLSNVQLQSGDAKAAEVSAKKAIELNPDDPESSIQLSAVYHAQRRYDESEKILKDLIMRDPQHATALNNYGYFLLERGVRFDEAFGMIEKAVSFEPINGSFLDTLGWAHFKLGRLEKARETLEKAMYYSRRNPAIHEHLGDVLRDLGRINEARRLWEKALEYSFETEEIARIKVKLKGIR